MKLFYVTFRDQDNGDPERVIIGQIGYRFSYTRIMPTCHHSVFSESIHNPPRFTRYFETRSRAVLGCKNAEEVVMCLNNPYPNSLIVTQFTPEQAKSLRTVGIELYQEIIYAFYQACHNGNANRIYSNMVFRLNARKHQREYFDWHGNHVYPQNYNDIRALYRDLGALVAQVEQDGDSTPVDEFLMDRCDRAGVDAIALYESISSKVNLGLTHCDCGHLE